MASPRTRKFRSFKILIILLTLTGAWYGVRRLLRPTVPAPTAELKARAARVRILRDEWGVPHIFGQKDADAAFGLAYAHAEDDFATIQDLTAASRGRLGWMQVSRIAPVNDFLVVWLNVARQVQEQYPDLSPGLRAVLEGYADGLNYYAAKHPGEVDARLLPFTGPDVAAGFVHRLPLLMGIDKPLQAVTEAESLQVGDVPAKDARSQTITGGDFAYGQALAFFDEIRAVARAFLPGDPEFAEETGTLARTFADRHWIGSNSHAVAPSRSADRVTRLNVNSHQPWEGPVAWYEAHVVSEEGWNMTGGTFPGGPMIFHGHNEHLGWAHTVNYLDSIDVYKLEVDAEKKRYRLDGEWRDFVIEEARIEIDLGLFTLPVSRPVYRSEHGGVIETDHGFYAFRYAGQGKLIHSLDQWFAMNKAQSFDEWRAAMRTHRLPMFNTTYADDRGNIYYVFNGLLPLRAKGFNYEAILPGDTSKNIWSEYLPYDRLPQVLNPRSGFVMNCNNDPFFTTIGPENPDRKDFDPEFGIMPWRDNRALRSMELFGGDASITFDEFLTYKWDRTFHPESPMYTLALNPILRDYKPRDEDERKALDILRAWNGKADEHSTGATLATLAYSPIWKAIIVDRAREIPAPADTFATGVAWLKEHYGRVDVPLGSVQFLRRGDAYLPIGGSTDVLNAVIPKAEDGRLIGYAGDSYILIVEFAPDGVRSHTLNVYGASARPDSPHYADQAPLFVRRTLRRNLFKETDIRARMEREYSP